jgi:asparagine synthase (glutamine-hydrolysing)
MCGIAGGINFSFDVPKLNTDLLHRGPDEQLSFEENGLQLHHLRLAIVDIACGSQPMHFEHLTIIYNGEVYNHLDVRHKLGLTGKTHSDTETILLAYAKLGADCLREFEGMYALAIYDKKKRELFLARGASGKKPLYYYADGKKFVFASELNALRNQLDLEIDEANIRQYLRAAYTFREATPYKNVKELPAGCYAYVSLDSPAIDITRWWNISDYYTHRVNDSFEDALESVEARLKKAVRARIESSDLEVGSFLSGGIDSGLITAIAKDFNPKLKTFTVSFDGQYDEAPLAKLVAERYDTQHREIRIFFDHLYDNVEKIVSNYGEPFFDSSAIPSYYVCKEAKRHLTVILNGDGGDELFGGYRRYVPFMKYDFFKSGFFVTKAAAALFPLLPTPNNKLSKYNYIHRLLDLARKKGVHTYLSSTLDVFEGFQQHLVGDDSDIRAIINDFERVNSMNLSGLQKILNLDFDHILASNLLVKMDIATMANSLEGRSPFMSRELLEYVPSLPDNYKIRGGQTKFLLRKLAEKYLPTELIHQPKRGFEIPLKKWIDNELKNIIASYVLSPNAYCRNFVKGSFIEDLWYRRVKTGDEKRAKMIWTLFTLEVWYRKCYLRS